jgi:LPXTG-motif cell wall-anchored protein
MTEIAVLGLLVLLLAAAGYLVRRKEREPEEGDTPRGAIR